MKLFKKNEFAIKNKRKNKYLSPFLINLLIIIILFIFIFNFWLKDICFNNTKNAGEGYITIEGELNNFSRNYQGDLFIKNPKFKLEMNNLQFSGESEIININNFSGKIYLMNNTMVFEGNAKNVSYDSNIFSLENENFKLYTISYSKFGMFFDELILKMEKGKINYGKGLSYNFEDTTIELKNFNASMSYDKSFNFRGKPDFFNIISNNGLTISLSK